jgi:N-acetylglucosaminyldiphosphoundecaprenol N-acetyl-beta-D-mannosaminyltransferase
METSTLNHWGKIDFMGVGIDPLTVDELLVRIADFIAREAHALVTCVNIYGYNLAISEPWLIDCWNGSEIVFCDGAGVILGARIMGQTIPERITYADWYWRLVELAEERDYSLFFLGARPGVAERAAEELRRRHPRLRIVGVHDGYFDMTPGSADNEALISQINAAAPDIVTVGMGMPLQERWLYDNWRRVNAHVGLTGGAIFDYVSGEVERAPRWMTDNGFEWLGRMLVEPRRLWKRYIIGNPQFMARVLKTRLLGPRTSPNKQD